MTLGEAIAILKGAGIESAEHDARLLFELYSEDNTHGYLSRDTACECDALELAIKRRASREPLQYIVGSVGFYREEYKVTTAVLIPRSDTEHLVDYAVKHIPSGERFADICTGSGCIAISTLKNTERTKAVAIDVSADALGIARENAELNGVSERISFITRDILKNTDIGDEKYYAVLSNPPYVSESAYRGLEPEIYAEPEIAFLGGEDGGDFYRALVPLAHRMIKPEGFIAFEIGYDQAELLISLAEKEGMTAEILRDYSGNDRVAVLREREA